jgi:hypothetical protein
MALTPPLSPSAVLSQVAQALPPSCRSNVIIIGSLAAGYHFFASDAQKAVRTKDVDCMFSPHAKAVAAAREVTEELLRAQWTPQPGTAWGASGSSGQPPEDLPLVRLRPPSSAPQGEWFIELLGAPDESIEPASGRRLETLATSRGHYALCSFRFLALAEWQPTQTDLGLRIARPEMMALANLLHHPAIGPEVMSGDQFGRPIKRSNKDLGRVLALAHLAVVRDRANDTDDFGAWPHTMVQALAEKFPRHAAELAAHAGNGIRELLASEADLDQALRTCNLGLLASFDIGVAALRATGQRLITEVIEPLADHHAPSSKRS